MTTLMIFHVRSKYTAVGRKEIITFFYLYIALTVISLILDSGVVPLASGVYPYFVAIQCGVVSATCWCLLVNGFVGFQFAEDGTPLSLWVSTKIFPTSHQILTVVITSLIFRSIRYYGSSFNMYLSRLGFSLATKYHSPLRRSLPFRRAFPLPLRNPTNCPHHQHPRRPMALGTHRFWCHLYGRRPSCSLCLFLKDMYGHKTLFGRPIFRHGI